MSFGHPILLLTLLAVPLAIGLYALLERRRMRYAITFTNIDVLASVAGRRSVRRYVPPVGQFDLTPLALVILIQVVLIVLWNIRPAIASL